MEHSDTITSLCSMVDARCPVGAAGVYRAPVQTVQRGIGPVANTVLHGMRRGSAGVYRAPVSGPSCQGRAGTAGRRDGPT